MTKITKQQLESAKQQQKSLLKRLHEAIKNDKTRSK
jgi:hypothetical protein